MAIFRRACRPSSRSARHTMQSARAERMIRLYHCTDARSFRPLWTLEELGLDYELTVMPFPPRYRAKAFMAVNPLGTIPALVDGETFMTESAAITQYLVTRYGPSDLAVATE